jgi:hypothetical protein
LKPVKQCLEHTGQFRALRRGASAAVHADGHVVRLAVDRGGWGLRGILWLSRTAGRPQGQPAELALPNCLRMPDQQQDDHGEEIGDPRWHQVGRIQVGPIGIGGIGFGRSGVLVAHSGGVYGKRRGLSRKIT